MKYGEWNYEEWVNGIVKCGGKETTCIKYGPNNELGREWDYEVWRDGIMKHGNVIMKNTMKYGGWDYEAWRNGIMKH